MERMHQVQDSNWNYCTTCQKTVEWEEQRETEEANDRERESERKKEK